MTIRGRAVQAIAKRKLLETFLGPGYYLALTVALGTSYILVTEFVRSIDASGFDYEASPLYDLIVRVLHGAFGPALLENLFAEGPYLLIMIVSFLPVLLYVSVSSIFRFGFERKVGAVELLCYGPVDGTAYVLACVVRDMVCTVTAIAAIAVLLLISAGINNLVLGPLAAASLVFLAVISLAISAYGVLSVVLTDSPSSAVIVFASVMGFFLVLTMGAFVNVSSYARDVVSVLSTIFQWISPFFYWSASLRALYGGNPFWFVGGLLSIVALSALVLFASSVAVRIRGVKP